MALGGYLFEGRVCNRGTLTDADWALLMHQTKVEAFLAANDRASAGWSLDMDDGVYNKLDPIGYNYMTRFENASAGAYLYVFTLCKFKAVVSASDVMAGYAEVGGFPNDPGSNNYVYGAGATNHVRLSKTRIATRACLARYTANATSPVMAAGNFGQRVSSTSFSGPTGGTFSSASTAYFGYAIKGADVICLSGGSLSEIQLTVASASGFANLTAPGDPYSMFIVNLSTVTPTGYGEASPVARDGLASTAWTCAADGYGYSINRGLYSFPIALTSNHTDEMSFNSIYMSGATTDTSITGTPLCYGKGTIKADLLSTSYYSLTNYPAFRQTVANGRFIAVLGQTSAQPHPGFNAYQGSFPNARQFIFVGWDETNPPLIEEDSWTEVTLPAPATGNVECLE